MGKEVKESDSVALKGHDLYISGVDWSHMGRYTMFIILVYWCVLLTSQFFF